MSESTVGKANIGVVGLAVMGSNLARNLASREGNTVAVFNRTFARTETLTGEHPEAGFVASEAIVRANLHPALFLGFWVTGPDALEARQIRI